MKIKSKILGLSYTGQRYSVVIEDLTDKKIKLPIIISDSAAIEITAITSGHGGASIIEKFIEASEVGVQEIYINDLNAGVFKVKITLENGNSFDTSVSESLIVAYSTKCEIYVSEDIMKVSGVKLKEDDSVDYSEIEYNDDDGDEELTPLEELKSQLKSAIEEERYEDAAEIDKKINELYPDN
ncbi:MAG: putative TM0160-like protein [uncultured marine phage]|uniref:Putative TM0160-like protein n=1 Tax=uncultured marine phage TaxID=707152 RepID=A0A8D9CD00_9VIRU|nr:MAG: putative TM0160-like protein [uncultured marine phage]